MEKKLEVIRRFRELSSLGGNLLAEEVAALMLSTELVISELLDVPEDVAQREAVKIVKKETGIDYSRLLKYAPAQQRNKYASKKEREMLSVKKITKAIGALSSRETNNELEDLGYQVFVEVEGNWCPTPKGAKWCEFCNWKSSDGKRSGYTLKWDVAHLLTIF